jgi:predicted DNA-binding protein with PD1-like motif
MKTAMEGSIVIVKLDDGEDLLMMMRMATDRYRIDSGLVHWGIGAVREFELGYFDGHEYHRRTFAPPHELLSLHGTLTGKSEPAVHLHMAAAGPGLQVVGGHLFKATVSTLGEICLSRLDDIRLTRVLNPKSGLHELLPEQLRAGAAPSM